LRRAIVGDGIQLDENDNDIVEIPVVAGSPRPPLRGKMMKLSITTHSSLSSFFHSNGACMEVADSDRTGFLEIGKD
jgi:hypothetical protein